MAKRVGFAVLRAVLAVLVAVAVLGAVLLAGLHGVVFREELYTGLPDGDGFTDGMTAYILDDLEAECLFYDLPFDVLRTAVTAEQVQSWAREYTAAVYEGLCTGQTVHDFAVSPAVYRPTLDAYFAELPEEERPPDEHATETLAQELADSTSEVLKGALVGTAVEYGYRFVYGDTPVRRAAEYYLWAIVGAALLAAVSLIPVGSDWRRRLYATAGAVFIGAALAAVPLWLFKRYGLTERLVLGDSPLKLYVSGVVDGITTGMTTRAMGVLVAAAVLLVTSVVLLTLKKETKDEGR